MSQSQPRSNGRFAPPGDPQIARAQELNEDGTARHLDDKRHLDTVIEVDRRRDARTVAQLELTEANIRSVDKTIAEQRALRARLMRQKQMLEERQAEDPDYDRHLHGARQNADVEHDQHREVSGILERHQRATGNVSVRVARDRSVDVIAE